MNAHHLSPGATTVYEALEDAGLVAGAVNITCYRGRHRYLPTLRGVSRAAYGPRRFFFYGLFESDRTGAPFAVRSRRAGSVDAYAAASDAGSSRATASTSSPTTSRATTSPRTRHGPDGAAADQALEQADAAIRALLDAAGGPDEFLERYAVVAPLRSRPDGVERQRGWRSPSRISRDRSSSTASNRAGQVYLLPGARVDAARAGAAAGRLRRGRRHAPPRGGRGRRAAGGCGRAGREARVSRRRPARPLGAREPERRRAARVGGRGLGARRSRRPPSCGRRQPRLARRGRLARPACDRRDRAPSCTGSPTSLRPCSPISEWRCPSRWRPSPVSADERARMVEWQLRRRGIDDERVLAAMGRVPRELFVPAELRHAAYADAALPIGARPDDLPAVHGRAHLRAARPARRRARARRRHGLRLPGRGTRRARRRGAHDRAGPGARGKRAREPRRRPGTRAASSSISATARSGFPRARRSPAIAVAAAALEAPPALYDQLEPRGRLVVPVGGSSGQWLEVVVRTPEGPAVVRTVPCRFVPLVAGR